ncbi:MAG: exodeoxyribonuclease VII small subunit [Bacteroidales bacterium]|nr:exodeoxyribonuclease VII small subunit [Bacteroidales bacterium]
MDRAEKMSYDEAYARLEEIVKLMESQETSLDKIGECLKEAASLIEFCKKELNGYKESFESILN